jgi:hypothetical protein
MMTAGASKLLYYVFDCALSHMTRGQQLHTTTGGVEPSMTGTTTCMNLHDSEAHLTTAQSNLPPDLSTLRL